jgi:phosphatidate cytidylyltransferase
MFWKRALSSVILIPIIISIVQWGTLLYSALVVGVAFLMLVEFCQLARLIGSAGLRIIVVLSGMLFCASALTEHLSAELVLAFTLFFAFASQIFRNQVNVPFLSVASALTGAVYIGWAFGYHLILLRDLRDAVGKPIGSELIFFLLAIIWCSDTAAYIFGKWLGKHKLIPRISPGKTIEGTIAGLCFGTLGGLGIWFFLPLKETFSLAHAFSLGLLLGVVSQIGDLSESVIKRSADVKDSGSLIPGHGGFLDRCDSLIFSAPTLYYYFQYLVRNA